MGCLRREPCRVPAPQLEWKRGIRGLVLPAGDGWHISAAKTSSERARTAGAELSRVLLELVLSTIVVGEPAAGLRAELVRLSSPPGRPAPPAGAIEHSILGLRSYR